MILQYLEVKLFFCCVAFLYFFCLPFCSYPSPSQSKSFTEIRAVKSNQKRQNFLRVWNFHSSSHFLLPSYITLHKHQNNTFCKYSGFLSPLPCNETFVFHVRYLPTFHFTFTPGGILYLTNTKNMYFQSQKKPCFLFPHLFSILFVAPLIAPFSLLLAFITSRYLFQDMCHLACNEPFSRKFQIFPIFVCPFFLISLLPVVFFIVRGNIFPNSIAKISFSKWILLSTDVFLRIYTVPTEAGTFIKEETGFLSDSLDNFRCSTRDLFWQVAHHVGKVESQKIREYAQGCGGFCCCHGHSTL